MIASSIATAHNANTMMCVYTHTHDYSNDLSCSSYNTPFFAFPPTLPFAAAGVVGSAAVNIGGPLELETFHTLAFQLLKAFSLKSE